MYMCRFCGTINRQVHLPGCEGTRNDVPVDAHAKVRVSAVVRVVDLEWVEISMSLRLANGSPWLSLTLQDHPMMMARRFSGGREVHELYAVTALKQVLGSGGATVLGLDGSETRTGTAGITEWRYWARLGGRFSVAMQTRGDGTVQVMDIA